MEVNSIMEQLLFTTVRVETQNADGSAGTGTSFIYSYNKEGKDYIFLVTNKHVIDNAPIGLLSFTKKKDGKPLIGERYDFKISDFASVWFGHPNKDVDVAICPFVPIVEYISKAGVSIFYRTIGNNFLPNKTDLTEIDALEDIVFVGYPNGIWDTKNLIPIIRKGITATPITMDFMGKKQFLIDASVFPGSSGSPVFLYKPGIYSKKTGGAVIGTRFYFLGIVASVLFRREMGQIDIITIPAAKLPVAMTREMIDLGIVFKGENIVETIETFLKTKAT